MEKECEGGDDCKPLYAKITIRVNELKKRYSDLLIDKGDLPMTGRMSIEGHRRQFRNMQVNLRKLLKEADAKGCTGYQQDAWHWATIEAPYPQGKRP